MKKYIGTKEVEAIPMTLGEFINKSGRNPYENDGKMHGNNEKGYLVKYKDGYESWSPAEPFEEAYKCADTFLDRLHIEYADLVEKFEKCTAFVDSEKFREVIKEDYPAFLLYLQGKAMENYIGTLGNRIDYVNGVEKKFNTYYNFGSAIEALKFGLAIRRAGWNGKGLFVVKQIPAHITEDIIPKMQSLPQSAKDIIMSRENKVIDYTSQMLIINPDGRADSWVPSVSDVFAEDWEIVI